MGSAFWSIVLRDLGDFASLSVLEGYDGEAKWGSDDFDCVVDLVGVDFLSVVGPGQPVFGQGWDCVGSLWIGL